MASKMHAWKKWHIFVEKMNFEVILEIENEKITELGIFAQTTEQILDNWKAKKPHWLKRTQHLTNNSFSLCMCWRGVTRVKGACFCGNCRCNNHFNFDFQSGKWHGPVCAGDLASFPGNQQYWQQFFPINKLQFSMAFPFENKLFRVGAAWLLVALQLSRAWVEVGRVAVIISWVLF